MVYLDHNATSPLRASARLAMEAALGACGNASSVHAAGRAARARIEEARMSVAGLAGATSPCVVFTSGGSEANALALRGAIAGAAQQEDRIARLFISAIEHESVRANASALAEAVPGLKLTEIPVTGQGNVDLNALRLNLIQGKGRVLVSVMAANNETGVVQDIRTIAKLIKLEGGEGALVHIDAVQAAGRTAVSFDAWGTDYMTLSAHKLGGPQGAGALLVRDGAPLAAQIAGGGQEMRRRSGTENVAAIAGFGAAAAELADFSDGMGALRVLRDRFEAELAQMAPGFESAERQLQKTQRLAQKVAADLAGADPMQRHAGKIAAEGSAAAVGHQCHGAAAGQQRARQGFRREHVSAGAAGGEHDHAGLAHVSTPPKRRRVSASAMPMPRPSASIDEPP